MKRLLVMLLCGGCSGTIQGGKGSTESPGTVLEVVEPSTPEPVIRLPAAVACDGRSVGRSYQGFAGEALDADRLPLAAGQDLARLRDADDLPNVLEGRGITAPVPSNVKQTFGVVPERWHQNTQGSFASVYAAYTLAFQGCLTRVKDPSNYHPFGHADFRASPTPASATRQCKVMSKLIWKRDFDAAELAACVELALETPSLETDVQRQWAALCASVGASAGFLLF